MSKYVLVIDPSASSPEENLYIHFGNTIKELKSKLQSLNLVFGAGKIYCATIDKKVDKERFIGHIRTADGHNWSKELSQYAFNPAKWARLDHWQKIGTFQGPSPKEGEQ